MPEMIEDAIDAELRRRERAKQGVPAPGMAKTGLESDKDKPKGPTMGERFKSMFTRKKKKAADQAKALESGY